MKETEIVKVDPNGPDIHEIRRAASIIKGGGLVAFPTETVYGLGADGLRSDTVDKIFLAKGRPQDNPLILHVASPEDLMRVAMEIPTVVNELIQLFWPGPLTLVLPKKPDVPDIVSAGLPTIGVRMPDNTIALTLIAESGTLLAAPSANLSGRPSPTQANHVANDMWGKIDLILDGGPTRIGVESTVLDMTQNPPRILRPGSVTPEELEDVLGRVEVPIWKREDRSSIKQVAPSMKYEHYALDIPLFLVSGEPTAIVSRIQEEAGKYRDRGKKVGIMSSEESKGHYLGHADIVRSLGSRYDLTQVAASLYHTLRSFESSGIHVLFAEGFSERGLGFAIMNRLRQAARGRCLMNRPETIVLVCTGNTCRSVMAEAMLRQALEETLGELAKDIIVISAGVSACYGDPASRHAKTVMEELGLDVSLHKAHPVSGKMLSDADLVLTMTAAQKDRLRKDYPSIESKIMTLTEFAGLTEELGEDIEDPFGGSLETYRTSAGQISRAVEIVVRKIKDSLQASR